VKNSSLSKWGNFRQKVLVQIAETNAISAKGETFPQAPLFKWGNFRQKVLVQIAETNAVRIKRAFFPKPFYIIHDSGKSVKFLEWNT
jgi:hypothetical protein